MGFFSAVKRFFGQDPKQGEKHDEAALPVETLRQPSENAAPSGETAANAAAAGSMKEPRQPMEEADQPEIAADALAREPDAPAAADAAPEADALEEAAGDLPAAAAVAAVNGPTGAETAASEAGMSEAPAVESSSLAASEAERQTAQPRADRAAALAETANAEIPLLSRAAGDDFAAVRPEMPDAAIAGPPIEAAAEAEMAAAARDTAGCAGMAAEVEPAIKTFPTDEQAAEDRSEWEDAMLLRLRQAEPRLSQWLEIVLADIEIADEVFWERLRFLLRSLEAPEKEVENFLQDFGAWLERMEYEHIDEFRSELQYRLALALDLEDEEDERSRLIVKLGQSLAATREQLGRGLDALFAAHSTLDDAFWEDMEELFIMADMGYEASIEIVERLKARAAKQKARDAEAARELLQDELEEIFKTVPKIRAANKPEVYLMMGVNGAGKTTTIAKLAYRERMNGKKVLVAAADTFRAAAIEQLEVWAKRAGADFYARPAGSDPASVAWEAMEYAVKHNIDVVFVDTAGRLQTRVNLMEELGKIRQVLGKKHPGAPHRSMLVLDATTGQNALSQAKLFREAAGADEIALTKLDGTAKGGVAIAIAMREKLPITFIGMGEKMEDLRPFNGRDFARAIMRAEN